VAIGLGTRSTISVARQPILDRRGQIFGHELLYRHSPDATNCISTSDAVGAEMLSDAVLSIGLDVLTSGRPAFINLTHRLLLEGAGMHLRSGTRDIEVTTRFVPHDVSGDDAIECMLVAGPSRDFNAMFRRGRARGRVVVVRAGDPQSGPTPFRLAYAAAGAHECAIAGHAPLRLPEGHALLVDATEGGSEDAAVAIRPLATGAVALIVSVDSP